MSTPPTASGAGALVVSTTQRISHLFVSPVGLFRHYESMPLPEDAPTSNHLEGFPTSPPIMDTSSSAPWDPQHTLGRVVPPPPTAADRLGSPASLDTDATRDSDDRGTFGPGRPWWGMGDIGLGAVFIIACVLIAGAAVGIRPLDDMEELVVLGLVQQGAMFAWPILVTKWKGTSLGRDWGLRFTWWDLPLGAGIGIAGLVTAALVSQLVASIVGLTDPESASNTGFLEDGTSTSLFVALLFITLIGAPLSEELFFRGLCLRAINNRFGPVAAVIGSTAMFVVLHLPSEFGDEWVLGTIVLWVSIATIGAVFAVTTLKLGRLGPAIVAHIVFNTIGVILSLAGPF